MLKRYIAIDSMMFALSYHFKTGMLYVVTIRRNEGSLAAFLEYIKPQHMLVEELTENSGKNFRTELKDYKGVPYIFRRAGQHSKLIYKALGGEVLKGLKDMEAVGMTVSETDSISSYRR